MKKPQVTERPVNLVELTPLRAVFELKLISIIFALFKLHNKNTKSLLLTKQIRVFFIIYHADILLTGKQLARKLYRLK